MSPISHEMTSQFNDLSKSLNALMSEKINQCMVVNKKDLFKT